MNSESTLSPQRKTIFIRSEEEVQRVIEMLKGHHLYNQPDDRPGLDGTDYAWRYWAEKILNGKGDFYLIPGEIAEDFFISDKGPLSSCIGKS